MENESGAFWIGVVIAMVVAVWIPDRAITQSEIDRGFTRCINNGGIARIRVGHFDNPTVWCKDGAEFSLPEAPKVDE